MGIITQISLFDKKKYDWLILKDKDWSNIMCDNLFIKFPSRRNEKFRMNYYKHRQTYPANIFEYGI